MRNSSKYAAIGYVVSKVVIPIAKKQAKKTAKAKARGAVSGTGGAIRRNPAKTSIAVGSALGAVGWLLTRRGDDSSDE